MVGLQSVRKAPTVHNGGIVQAQSQFMLQGGDYPFINMMKTMQSWTYVTGGAAVEPPDLDSNGYPTVINSGGVSNILFLPPSKMGPGTTWVFDWDGRGTCNVFSNESGSITITNGATLSNLSGAASNRVEFTFPSSVGGQCTIAITARSSSTDYPRNLRLYLKSEEAALKAGFITSSDFRNLWKRAKCGVKRFLNWQKANSSNVTTFATRKPAGFYSYNADEYRSSLYATANGGTGDAFTATLGSGGPVDKQTVIVKFDHPASTGAWTFDLNGSGPLPMVEAGAAQYGAIAGTKPSSGVIATLVFDSDMNTWLKYGGYSGNQSGLRNGIPLEVIIQVCGELGCHPYFVTPPLAVETNWLQGLDSLMQAVAPSWMIPRYEIPNENWNNVFFANYYSLQKALAWWGTNFNGNHYWAGRVGSLLGQIVDASRGGDRTKYQLVSGVQSATYLPSTATSNPRLNSVRGKGFWTASFSNGSANITATGNTFSANAPVQIIPRSGQSMPTNFSASSVYFVKTTGDTLTLAATQGGTTIVAGSAGSGAYSIVPADGLPAYNWVTTVACTNYVNPYKQGKTEELSLAFQFSAGTLPTAPDTYASINTVTQNDLATSYAAWFAWANSFGPSIKLCAYEGGWSPDYMKNTDPTYGIISNAVVDDGTHVTLTIAQTMFQSSTLAGNGCVVGMPLVIGNVVGMTQLNTDNGGKLVTCTVAAPGVFDWGSAHGLPLNQPVTFCSNTFTSKSGAPTPVLPGLPYYIQDNAPGGNANKFTISATPGGAAIAITTAISGSLYVTPCVIVSAVNGNSVTVAVSSTAGFGAYVSGGSAIHGNYGNNSAAGSNMCNALRYASKAAAQLNADTLTNYQQFIAAGAEFPSCFQLAGNSNVWSVWDPDIFASAIPPQWIGLNRFTGGTSS